MLSVLGALRLLIIKSLFSFGDAEDFYQRPNYIIDLYGSSFQLQ